MKSAGWIALLAALLTAAPPAIAQPGGGREGAGRGERFLAERQEQREQRRELRSELRGDSGRDDRNDGASGRCDGPCRMTREERMQLRRDIHDAGRDLYRHGPRRGRD